MRSPVPKVLHPLGGRPMILFLLDRLAVLSGWRRVCVVGHDRDAVRAALPAGVDTVVQWPPRGTGDAVRVARSKTAGARILVVMPADAPMVSPETLRQLVAEHTRRRALATVLTTELEDPGSYGRVVHDADGSVRRIVEALDADAETLAIRRINTGVYAFDPKALFRVIDRIGTANQKGEFYLTDAIELLAKQGKVASVNTDDSGEVAGVNTLADLAKMEGHLQKKIRGKLMDNGVQIPHPQSVYIEPGVRVAAGARLLPGTHLVGRTRIAAGAVIGPGAYISDSTIGERARVRYSVVAESVIEADVSVGPFAHVRPGTRVSRGARIGNFVETKASVIGRKARISHLSYVGDSTVGEDANIGAGTITCNYDGVQKHKTSIGRRAFIGSNSALVAPVTVGDGAVVGAGSVITKNVAPGSLALTRAAQVAIPGWAKRRTPARRRK